MNCKQALGNQISNFWHKRLQRENNAARLANRTPNSLPKKSTKDSALEAKAISSNTTPSLWQKPTSPSIEGELPPAAEYIPSEPASDRTDTNDAIAGIPFLFDEDSNDSWLDYFAQSNNQEQQDEDSSEQPNPWR